MLHTKTIRGLKTGWLQAGRRQPGKPILMFIHGFPDSAENWDPQLEYFSKSHLVIVPYLRGMGPSENTNDKSRYGLDSVALDHLEILKEVDPLGESNVVVVGHDIGGPHAWHLARLLKNRLDKLVVINGPSLDQMVRRFTMPRQLSRSWYIGVLMLPKLPELLMRRWGDRIIKNARKKGGLRDRSPIPAHSESLIQHYREAFKTTFAALRQKEVVEKPVLVLWGKNDPFLIPPTPKEIDRIARNHTIRVLDGGHWLNRETPDRVNSLIEDFIA